MRVSPGLSPSIIHGAGDEVAGREIYIVGSRRGSFEMWDNFLWCYIFLLSACFLKSFGFVLFGGDSNC